MAAPRRWVSDLANYGVGGGILMTLGFSVGFALGLMAGHPAAPLAFAAATQCCVALLIGRAASPRRLAPRLSTTVRLPAQS